jgi:hypothetical protein
MVPLTLPELMPVHLPPLFCQFSAPGLFTEFFSDYLR